MASEARDLREESFIPVAFIVPGTFQTAQSTAHPAFDGTQRAVNTFASSSWLMPS